MSSGLGNGFAQQALTLNVHRAPLLLLRAVRVM